MKAEDWKRKQIEHARLGREIRDAVDRTYLVPTWNEESPISTAIAIRAEDMASVKVMAVHSGAAIRGGLISPISVDVLGLDIFTLEALARTLREVQKWSRGERDELPTAEELQLIDPAAHKGPAHVIGQPSSTPPTEYIPTPPKTHLVDDSTRLPPKPAPGRQHGQTDD